MNNTKEKTILTPLEEWFAPFRENVIGQGQTFESPFGTKEILYTDWTASGRLYRPIEELMQQKIGPMVANTHTETNVTGSSMTIAYHKAQDIIKKHVGATDHDILITSNAGMTGVINKFQRILGMKIHENFRSKIQLSAEERPLVIVTHMEHHSNQTSWLETTADVVVIPPDDNGCVDLNALQTILDKYKDRTTKIAAITSCSNVTGIKTPYHKIAAIMHQNGGLCFVDFACSAPYIDIDMHPDNEDEKLDAIYFSPHKFLGGPGTSGVLVFCSTLYKNTIPDNPGGGTVDWTNPWGEHKYLEEIEAREDGGTPGFLQTIRIALSIQLKEKMQVDKILAREHEMLERIWRRFDKHDNLHILADNMRDRLGVVSFYVEDLHYNLGVKLLNDHFGVQVRGGCSCAGTYGHFLLEVSPEFSNNITTQINAGDLTNKPGWMRFSIHPTMTNEELDRALDAVDQLCLHHKEWAKDYTYNSKTNEFTYNGNCVDIHDKVDEWFTVI